MKHLLRIATAAGVAVVIGSVAYVSCVIATRLMFPLEEEQPLTRAQCQEEAERAVIMGEVDVHLTQLTTLRNEYARRVGAEER